MSFLAPSPGNVSRVDQAIIRAWPNVRTMLSHRRMDVSALPVAISHVESIPLRVCVKSLVPRKRDTVVIFMGAAVLRVKSFRAELAREAHRIVDFVVLCHNGITTYVQNEIQAYRNRCNIQVHKYTSFYYCYVDHEFVRHQRAIEDPVVKQRILAEHGLTDDQLPKMTADDPFAMYFALSPGTLVVNERRNGVDEISPYLRIVTRDRIHRGGKISYEDDDADNDNPREHENDDRDSGSVDAIREDDVQSMIAEDD